MTNKYLRPFVCLILAMLGMSQSAVAADFKDFSVIVNNQTGTLLTSEEQVQGTAVEFGVAVAADGTVSRVAAGDASSVATVSGKYHSDHGCTNLKVVVPVPGDVTILGSWLHQPQGCCSRSWRCDNPRRSVHLQQ